MSGSDSRNINEVENYDALLRANLQRVFNERDAQKRIAAVHELLQAHRRCTNRLASSPGGRRFQRWPVRCWISSGRTSLLFPRAGGWASWLGLPALACGPERWAGSRQWRRRGRNQSGENRAVVGVAGCAPRLSRTAGWQIGSRCHLSPTADQINIAH